VIATVAGAMVVTLGFINFGYGANLTGLNAKLAQVWENLKIISGQPGGDITDPNVTLQNGV